MTLVFGIIKLTIMPIIKIFDMSSYILTLTMRHPSWIFLFFGGRIVTFAPV